MLEAEVPADATTLIYLAKADSFDDAARCVRGLLVPPSVWRESVEEGEKAGYADAERIRNAEAAGFLHLVALTPVEDGLAGDIASSHRLGAGESEVLALGQSSGRVFVDDGRASRVAEALGIVPVSTLFLPVLGRMGGGLDSADAEALLRRLAVVSSARAETVYEIQRTLEEVNQ